MTRLGLLRLSHAAVLLLSTTACQSTLYDWGPYEDSVLSVEGGFQDSDLLAEIDALELLIEENIAQDRRPLPGLHAQAGYLQYLAGNSAAALRHFQAEKAIYPESTVFMDRLIRGL